MLDAAKNVIAALLGPAKILVGALIARLLLWLEGAFAFLALHHVLVPAEVKSSFVSSSEAIAGAIGTAIINWIIFKISQVKAIDKATTGAAPVAKITGGNVSTLLILVASVGAMSLAGCGIFAAPTPLTPQDKAVTKVAIATGAYIVGAAAIEDAFKHGEISRTDYETVWRPLEQTAFNYLSAAKTAADAGETVNAATQLELFYKALGDFTGVNIPGAVTAPTTQPTTRPE